MPWRGALAQEGHTIFAAPGNPGIAQVGRVVAHDWIILRPPNAFEPDLTVVGPEAPLVAGIVDQFRARGLRIVGPDQDSGAARRQQDSRQGLHAARWAFPLRASCAVRIRRSRRALRSTHFDYPVVVKADGLAAGQGRRHRAGSRRSASRDPNAGSAAGHRRISRRRRSQLHRPLRRTQRVPLEATQDHKTVHDGDTGPNTGGMGAYCDGRILSNAASQRNSGHDHRTRRFARPASPAFSTPA